MATATATSTLPTAAPPLADLLTLGDLLEALGGIDPSRVRLHPTPGTATFADLRWLNERKQGIYELIDGTLVAKPMSRIESMLAVAIIRLLSDFINARNLGIMTGADGDLPISARTYRIPDVAFIAWDRIPPGPLTEALLAEVTADLAVEVLSPSNTRAEMARKRTEYFAAGVRLVWEVDPPSRTVAVYLTPDEATILDATATLDGGAVLPGFRLPVADLFADLDRQRP